MRLKCCLQHFGYFVLVLFRYIVVNMPRPCYFTESLKCFTQRLLNNTWLSYMDGFYGVSLYLEWCRYTLMASHFGRLDIETFFSVRTDEWSRLIKRDILARKRSCSKHKTHTWWHQRIWHCFNSTGMLLPSTRVNSNCFLGINVKGCTVMTRFLSWDLMHFPYHS